MAQSEQEKRRKNAQKQHNYRQRHLKETCDRVRLQCNFRSHIKHDLEKLACYHGYTETEMLEALIKEAVDRVELNLNEEDAKLFNLKMMRHGHKTTENGEGTIGS